MERLRFLHRRRRHNEHQNEPSAHDIPIHIHTNTSRSARKRTQPNNKRRLVSSLHAITLTCLFFFAPSAVMRVHGIVTGRIDIDIDIDRIHNGIGKKTSNGDGDGDGDGLGLVEAWTVVKGPANNPVIVTLSDGSSKVNSFQDESMNEKASYAKRHNYTLLHCPTLLDDHRPATWSKLKLLHHVYKHTSHPIILWLDVDTIIWDRQRTIQSLLTLTLQSQSQSQSQPASLTAQIDLHRSMQSKYINAGILLLRKLGSELSKSKSESSDASSSSWMMRVLARAYRQYQIVLLQGILYFDADQDALNMVMKQFDTSDSTSIGDGDYGGNANHNHNENSDALEHHLNVKKYGQLWTLPKDRKYNPFVLHFPNCIKGRCAPEYLQLYREAMAKDQGYG